MYIIRNRRVNEGVTILFFVVINLVCVPKKRNLSIFLGLKGTWKHIRTPEWKLKRDVVPVPSEMTRSLAQEEGVDPYHLDLVLLPLFFEHYRVGFFSYPHRIEHAEQNLLHVNPVNLDWENHTDFMKPCAMARIRSQPYFR